MKITTIRLATAKTINLGNFQSLRIEADVTGQVSEDEDLAAAKVALQSELTALLAETYRAQRKEPEAKTAPPRDHNPAPGSFTPARAEPEY